MRQQRTGDRIVDLSSQGLQLWLSVFTVGCALIFPTPHLLAQPSEPGILPPRPPAPAPPDLLPPPTELLPIPTRPNTPDESLLAIPGTITVDRFEIEGSTIFSPEQLTEIVAPFTRCPITFAELTQAAEAIAKLYTDQGYVTSGAFIPANQVFQRQGGTVKIQVVEGNLEAIQVQGLGRLAPGYVQSRLAVSGSQPLNIHRLLEGLQLLQLDPLIQNISAELAAGTRPGQSVLKVAVVEAQSFKASVNLDNTRSPSVGEFRRQVQLSEGNLLGLGDRLNLSYANTDGSDAWEAGYTLPINPYNGTVHLGFSTTSSRVIESPFNQVNITAASRNYELTWRQPLSQTPEKEFAIGLTLDRLETETSLYGLKFPLSAGADAQGSTRVTALRFFQEYTSRGQSSVVALRSQFSLGIDWLNSTLNAQPPDGRFFAWRGQAQYVQLLAPDTLLLLRGEMQLADRPLLALEQFGVGGPETVRGYRQDALLTDNGVLATAEVRLPIARVPQMNGVLQLTPFIDFGSGWNHASPVALNTSTLASAGLGLLWRQGDRLSARLDWGIPLISASASKRTWQENGLYFSIVYSPF